MSTREEIESKIEECRKELEKLEKALEDLDDEDLTQKYKGKNVVQHWDTSYKIGKVKKVEYDDEHRPIFYLTSGLYLDFYNEITIDEDDEEMYTDSYKVSVYEGSFLDYLTEQFRHYLERNYSKVEK